MHSIDFITLSRDAARVKKLERSIDLAMGPAFAWKLTVVDGNQHDLFTGYNAGAAQTTADIMVFVHDDVQFMGNAMTFGRPFELLNDPSTGFIGIVGARNLMTSGVWWSDASTPQQARAQCRGMVINPQPNAFGMHAFVWPGRTAEYGQVIALDGVMLMCHRRTFESLNGLDSQNFTGFHFYDIDTTFRAHLLGLKNYAAPIPLLHGSLGNYTEQWHANRLIFIEKHKAALPCSL